MKLFAVSNINKKMFFLTRKLKKIFFRKFLGNVKQWPGFIQHYSEQVNLKTSFYMILLSLYVYFDCLTVCLFACLYPINFKTAEPIGPKFVVGKHMTPGKVYGWSKFQKLASTKICFLIKFWKSTKFLQNPRTVFFFNCFTMYTKRKCSQLKKKMDAKRPGSLV